MFAKVGKRIAGILAFTTVSVVSAAVGLYLTTGYWLDEKLVLRLAPLDSIVHFESTDFSLRVHNSGFLGKRIEFNSAGGFCARAPDERWRVCFDRFEASTRMHWNKRLRPTIDEIGPIRIEASSLRVSPSKNPPPPKEPEAPSPPSRWIPSFASDFRLREARMTLADGRYERDDGFERIGFRLEGAPTSREDVYGLGFEASLKGTADPRIIEVSFDSTLDRNTDFRGTLKGYVGSPRRKPEARLQAGFVWNMRSATGELEGSAKFKRLAEMLPEAELTRFKIRKADDVSLETDWMAVLDLGKPIHRARSALPAPELALRVVGKANARSTRIGDDAIRFDVSIPKTRQWGFDLDAETRGTYHRADGRLDLARARVELATPRFRSVVDRLRMTQLAIPAPLNEMDGSVSLRVGQDGTIVERGGRVTLPIRVSTDLSSPNQKFITSTEGAFSFPDRSSSNERMKLELLAKLARVDLYAPNLNPVSPAPAFRLDSRIVRGTPSEGGSAKKPKAKPRSKPPAPAVPATDAESMTLAQSSAIRAAASGSNASVSAPMPAPAETKPVEAGGLDLDLRVETGDPMIIRYRLFHPYAAFNGGLRVMTGKPVELRADLEPMDVEYFSRRARVERLAFSLAKDGSPVLSSRLTIVKDTYHLHADIYEAGGSTSITLSSDPPLSDEDIISLVLFNDLARDLDTNLDGSVRDTQSAISQRAIGFLSFFVLASTPVDSVAYDPATKMYSARVSLPGGVSATVGSDWQKSQEVGFRKRIGGKWSISATTRTDSEGETRQESLLEWFNRY